MGSGWMCARVWGRRGYPRCALQATGCAAPGRRATDQALLLLYIIIKRVRIVSGAVVPLERTGPLLARIAHEPPPRHFDPPKCTRRERGGVTLARQSEPRGAGRGEGVRAPSSLHRGWAHAPRALLANRGVARGRLPLAPAQATRERRIAKVIEGLQPREQPTPCAGNPARNTLAATGYHRPEQVVTLTERVLGHSGDTEHRSTRCKV